ncbi:LpqN/LpqT family lipoprotein [Mycolicibacterium arseniciresistens]|uniref:LpqN/LpqT family lipoprotein n=1 Tax=Mycolicibacterium arseniciresistens TaxID=3062257 RepID=A0ABT8UB07_9MYCO|nr:LpqN/LpqT family lipoprotein [Mycolicibacterium arseniciresistens]MDO3634302.1 LpqN/LpqT family lipoprotein [Mycolicibacterium arseniciresistens]
MKTSGITGAVAAAAVLGLALSGCGSDTEPAASSTSSATSSESPSSTTSSAAAAPDKLRIAPRDEDAAGANPTIASYIAENGIKETPVKMGDPGAPVIDLPIPEGWVTAGDQTPEWAYGAIAYTGPESEQYQPSIVALVSRLEGNVDPQAIIDLASGELKNLSGWSAMNEGETSTLGEYPAFQLGGTWVQDGVTKLVAQKTVVIPGPDAVYVLQLNADSLEDQGMVLAPATMDIDEKTTITF